MIKYSSVFGISIQVLFIQLYGLEYPGLLVVVSLFQVLLDNKASACELEFGEKEMKQTQKVFVRGSHCYSCMEWGCPQLALGRNQMAACTI